MKNIIKIGNKKPEYYNGLLLRADEKLHEQIAMEISSILPKVSKILDLGCGQGALSMRLTHLGYNVLAVDVNQNDFKANDVPFEFLDFNVTSAVDIFIENHRSEFDLVLGVEVIEHLENPWSYVRSLKALVKKNGLILITTPNITSWYSRAVFFFTGLYPGFVDPDECGHINPISEWELKVIAKKEHLKIIKMRSAGNLPPIWINTSFKKVILNLFFLPFFPIARGLKTGWCIMTILKNE